MLLMVMVETRDLMVAVVEGIDRKLGAAGCVVMVEVGDSAELVSERATSAVAAVSLFHGLGAVALE